MTQLGKYELHEQLGKGSFGTVYRATDLSLDRVVALKVLHPLLSMNVDFVERFRQEAKLAAALKSHHILNIYEVGEERGSYFIAMEYYSGGSLADLLKAGPLPWQKAVEIMEQVCAGLHKLHERGGVHRDLKPTNILFDAEDHAVVADFGQARALTGSGSSSSGMGAGTPFYRAPELWNGKPPASPATDVYSLGCILGEMLTGKPLFAGETPEEVLTRHLVHGPDFGEGWPPEEAPTEIGGFVQRCLSRVRATDRKMLPNFTGR